MILPVIAYGDPILRKVGVEIDKNYPDLQKLIADMYETMYHSSGVGIAAPQVGKYLMHAMSRKDLSLPERYRKYEVQLENSLHRFMKEYRTLQSESVNEEPNEFANGVIDEIDAAPNLQNEATEAVQGAEERTADEPEVIDIETAKTNPANLQFVIW